MFWNCAHGKVLNIESNLLDHKQTCMVKENRAYRIDLQQILTEVDACFSGWLVNDFCLNVVDMCQLSAGLSALPGGVKFPDSAGAFHYEDSGKLLSVTSNRFIHWSVSSPHPLHSYLQHCTQPEAFISRWGHNTSHIHVCRLTCKLTFTHVLLMLCSYPESWHLNRSTSGDTVQLVEQSLDTNLLNNAIKLKFSHCPVLPGGVHIQETLNNVIILICTNQSVHRLLLAHPTRMYRSVSRQYRDTKGYIFFFIKYGNLLAPPFWSLSLNFWSPHAACNEELCYINTVTMFSKGKKKSRWKEQAFLLHVFSTFLFAE